MNAYVVDRKALEQNIQVLREKAGDTPIYGVIKGNGYGLGLIPMAQVLREGGIDRFAVTGLKEVCALREGGFAEEEILMMRATCIPEELEVLLEQNATATVGSLECATTMDQVAERMGKPFLCHLKIDTGMGRYGFLPDQLEEMQKVYSLPHLQVTGIYTHFHSAPFSGTARCIWRIFRSSVPTASTAWRRCIPRSSKPRCSGTSMP